MKKQVPEEKDQLEFLHQKLLGNNVFKACRGKGGATSIFSAIEKTDNPSQFCSDWNRQTAELRVMGNLLAQLKRDGWEYAFSLLKNALIDNYFLFPGEVVEKTRPFTIIMPNSTKNLTLLRWITTIHPHEMYKWLRLAGAYDYLDRFPFHNSGLLTSRAILLQSISNTLCFEVGLYLLRSSLNRFHKRMNISF
ncbi:MAG: hypothetical protein WA055_04985 [Candidatus Moraniibacteriota bacterium]